MTERDRFGNPILPDPPGFGAGGSWARLEIAGGRRVFAPGDELEGRASWHLEEEPEWVEVRLYWRTEGKGDQDVDVVAEERWETPGRDSGDRPFRFELPAGPYSFSGTLITLYWGVELVAEPGGALDTVDLTVTPTGGEIRLGSAEPDSGIGVP